MQLLLSVAVMYRFRTGMPDAQKAYLQLDTLLGKEKDMRDISTAFKLKENQCLKLKIRLYELFKFSDL